MLYRKEGFPEESELVICKVTKIHYNSVFAELLEYRKQGMIHISEISPGRIRNISDYVKVGKVVICKVLSINQHRGHIDLSLRRVSEMQKRDKNNEIKQEQKAEKIIEFVAKELNMPVDKLYYQVFDRIKDDYQYLHHFFEDVVENDVKVSTLGLDDKITSKLEEIIHQRIKPKEVVIGGDIEITSFAPNGVEVIKGALLSAEDKDERISISYGGAGKYKIRVKSGDYKTSEKLLKEALVALEHTPDCKYKFNRKD